jgi:formate hydrogenlyase subunit 3/multisubunit Na+/H+ antiporter MnhD subunit
VFAGLLTKVGVYAIIRTETIIFPGSELNPVLMVLALLTMVVGVLGAVAQADIKRLLSFTLVSHIGYMILGVALGSAAGTSAAIFYIVHHIVVQTTLFLATNWVDCSRHHHCLRCCSLFPPSTSAVSHRSRDSSASWRSSKRAPSRAPHSRTC